MAELETPGNESDPIERLHKMSTTAGVGSQEYVAVNNFAVFAAVLGVASGLAILALPLLVVPAAAVIFGVWSLVQIGRSNGTQGGRLLASLGIILAVVISGALLFGNWRQKVMYRDQEVRVNAVIAQLGNVLREGKIGEAYALFDDVYRQKVSERVFADRWKAIVDTPSVGPLVSLTGNNRFRWASPPPRRLHPRHRPV
jgi:hypothetical protein